MIVLNSSDIEEYDRLSHQQVLLESKAALQDQRRIHNDPQFEKLMTSFPPESRRTFSRGKETGVWLSVTSSILNGTDLSAQEFRDTLAL